MRFDSKHHRRPVSRGGTETFPHNNISWVKRRHHEAWHKLFGNHCPTEIARIINELYLDPDWEVVARRK